jgi:hypothetical protein
MVSSPTQMVFRTRQSRNEGSRMLTSDLVACLLEAAERRSTLPDLFRSFCERLTAAGLPLAEAAE